MLQLWVEPGWSCPLALTAQWDARRLHSQAPRVMDCGITDLACRSKGSPMASGALTVNPQDYRPASSASALTNSAIASCPQMLGWKQSPYHGPRAIYAGMSGYELELRSSL